MPGIDGGTGLVVNEPGVDAERAADMNALIAKAVASRSKDADE